MLAADSVVEEQTRKLAIQRRFQADMREIWFMQARFERANAKSIWRMAEQPRFRAAVDFLQLRAESCATFERRSVLARRSRLSSSDRSPIRSEEHTSELQSLMRISYAVF